MACGGSGPTRRIQMTNEVQIATVSEFRDAITRLLEESKQWGVLEGELHAVNAWTANGRTPLHAERVASMLAFRAARELDGVAGPADLVDHLQRVQAVGWFFSCWPAQASEVNRGALATSATPSIDNIDRLAAALRRELIAAGEYNIPRPPESAFASQQPRFRDTMTGMEWVRWVLLVRLDSIVAGTWLIPPSSQLCRLCGGMAVNPKWWGILYVLGQIDELFIVPVEG